MQNLASVKKLFSLANSLYAGKPFASFASGKYGKLFDSQFDNGHSPFSKLVVYNLPPFMKSFAGGDALIPYFKKHIDEGFAEALIAWQKNPASSEAKDVLIKLVGTEFQFNGSTNGTEDTKTFDVTTFVFSQNQAKEILNHYRENIVKLEAVTGATVVAYYNTTEYSMTPEGEIHTQPHPMVSVESTQWDGGELSRGKKKGLLNVSTCVGSKWDGRAYKPRESSIDGFKGATDVFPVRFDLKRQEMKAMSATCEMKVVLRTCIESTWFVEGKDYLFEVILGAGAPDLENKADIGSKFIIIGEADKGKDMDGIWLHQDVIKNLEKLQELISPDNRIKLDGKKDGQFQRLKPVEHRGADGNVYLTETTLDLSFLKDPESFAKVFLGTGTSLQDEVAVENLKPEALEGGSTSEHGGDHIHGGDHPHAGGEYGLSHEHRDRR